MVREGDRRYVQGTENEDKGEEGERRVTRQEKGG